MVNVKVYFTLDCAVRAQSRVKRYSSALSLTLVLGRGWVSGSRFGRLVTGNDQTPVVQEAAWVPGSVLTSAEHFGRTRIRFPDCPVCSKSQYRLSYPGPRK